MRQAISALFLREWRIARRIGGGASIGAVFFLILVVLMPFAIGPDLNLLSRIGPAILWLAALLASLLALDRLFAADHDDGSLDLETFEQKITGLPGIGPWTAQYIAMRLGEPDAFPSGDLYLREIARDAEAWRPWRAYAAMYWWKNRHIQGAEK